MAFSSPITGSRRGKSDRGPVHSVQVRPASLAEWQKQVRIGILGHIRREFSEIEARLQRDFNDPSDHSVAEVDYDGGSKESHSV